MMNLRSFGVILIILLISLAFSFPTPTHAKQTDTALELPDAVFGESLGKAEQVLISKYVEFILQSHQERTKQIALNTTVNGILNDDFWGSIDVTDEDLNKTLKELKNLISRMNEFFIPSEQKLAAEMYKLGQEFTAMAETVQKSGKAPDNFMEIARRLEKLYAIYDDVLAVKSPLLNRIAEQKNRIVRKYVEPSDEIIEDDKRLIKVRADVFSGLLYVVNQSDEEIEKIKKAYAEAEDQYNSLQKELWSLETKGIQALIDEIGNQVDHLNEKKGENEIEHAEVLEKISGLLKDKIEGIEESKISLDHLQTTREPFLYLPELFSGSNDQEGLKQQYKRILVDFIAQTEKRTELIWGLSGHLFQLKQKVYDHQSEFAGSVSVAGHLSQAQKDQIIDESEEYYSVFKAYLSFLEENIKQIITLSDNANLKKPDAIIKNSVNSIKAVSINRLIEKLVMDSLKLSEYCLELDSFQYQTIYGNDAQPSEKGKNQFELLIAENSTQEYVTQIGKISETYKKDVDLTHEVRVLGQEIIKTTVAQYATLLSDLDAFFKTEKPRIETPYFDFLIGVNEYLKGEYDYFNSLNNQDNIQKCSDCGINQTLWSRHNSLSFKPGKLFERIDNIEKIKSYFSKEKIDRTVISEHIKDYFAVTELLQISPTLWLNDDSIDLIFQAGSKLIIIKGIGNENAIILSLNQYREDPLIITPYIGGNGFGLGVGIEANIGEGNIGVAVSADVSFNPLKAFQDSIKTAKTGIMLGKAVGNGIGIVKDKIENKVEGALIDVGIKTIETGFRVYKSATDFISDAKVVKNKIEYEIHKQHERLKREIEEKAIETAVNLTVQSIKLENMVEEKWNEFLLLYEKEKEKFIKSCKEIINNVNNGFNIAQDLNILLPGPPGSLKWKIAKCAINMDKITNNGKLTIQKGVFCGPNWSGGRFVDENDKDLFRNPEPESDFSDIACLHWNKQAESILDDVGCRIHDYVLRKLDADTEVNSNLKLAADIELIKTALSIRESDASWQAYKECLIAGFVFEIGKNITNTFKENVDEHGLDEALSTLSESMKPDFEAYDKLVDEFKEKRDKCKNKIQVPPVKTLKAYPPPPVKTIERHKPPKANWPWEKK